MEIVPGMIALKTGRERGRIKKGRHREDEGAHMDCRNGSEYGDSPRNDRTKDRQRERPKKKGRHREDDRVFGAILYTLSFVQSIFAPLATNKSWHFF